MPNPFSRTAWPATALAALTLALFGIFRTAARWSDLASRVPELLALLLAAGILYLAGVWIVERFPLGRGALFIILGGALAFRLCWLPLAPTLSEDVYRYQWEGRVVRFGLNPYTTVPDSPRGQLLQDPAHPIHTGHDTPTLYPPLSEAVFAAVKSLPACKRMFAALDLATLALLLGVLARVKQPLGRVLVYAWNPTVLVAFSLDGHHDSLALLTTTAALLLILIDRRVMSTVFLALAFLAKFFPLVLLPVFLKRAGKRYAALFAGVVAVAYVPFLSAGRELFRGLGDYARGWEGNDSLFRLITLAGNTKAQAELVAVVIVLGLIAYTLKRQLDPIAAGLLLIPALLFVSPNAFPWYFTWLVPFLCFRASAPLLLMTVTCVLGYSPVVAYAAGQPYVNSPLMLALEYVPVLAWLAWQALFEIRKSKFETRPA